MQVTITVEGVTELANEMLRTSENLGRSVQRIVPLASRAVASTAADVCEPGQRWRRIVRRRGHAKGKEYINRGTDTSRYATHFVVFYRQDKPKYYVPVTPNPYGADFNDTTNERKLPDYPENEYRNKKNAKRGKWETNPFKYQQRRKSTIVNKRGKFKRYDTPAEIKALRKIGRRGLASNSWAWLGRKVRGAKGGGAIKLENPTKEKKLIVERATRLRQVKEKNAASVNMKNKLKYISERYPGVRDKMITMGTRKLQQLAKAELVKERKRLEARQKAKSGATS